MSTTKPFYVRKADRTDEVVFELVNRETGEVEGDDMMAPEDALLVRSLRWVPELCNRLAAERDRAQSELIDRREDACDYRARIAELELALAAKGGES